ncbi:response regulator [Kluyvera cryocrescens]|uniref:response regulator n=1 Tax=Kluyvera cryocrescens TaxID=580 RepID=UPI002DB5DE2B|nr:response regulator [Kluyvera cryocrescens]MEB6631172.1 response regulator [Kluyvera cryocrescens]
MNILLIEDETTKAAKIINCLMESSTNNVIQMAKSVTSGIDAIHNNSFDLILLDMSLPTFDISKDEYGGKPQGFGGKEILREMLNYEMVTPVIVITAYEAFSENGDTGKVKEQTFNEIKEELELDYPTFYRGIIKYETIFNEWQNQLQKLIKLAE